MTTLEEIVTMDETEFVKLHDKLVHSICCKFDANKVYRNTGLSYEDLYQVGMIGLIKAKRNFNPDYGYKFSTYAVPSIIGEIQRHLHENSKIHISRNIVEAKTKIAKNDLFEASDEIIAERLAIPITYVKQAKALHVETSYLHEIIDDEKGGATLEEWLTSNESAAEIAERNIILEEFISTFSEAEIAVWNEYRKEKPQSEIGKAVGLSQPNVSRTLSRIFNKARSFGKKHGLYN